MKLSMGDRFSGIAQQHKKTPSPRGRRQWLTKAKKTLLPYFNRYGRSVFCFIFKKNVRNVACLFQCSYEAERLFVNKFPCICPCEVSND